MSSEGRFDDLRAILSSNAGVGEVKTDTTISKPPSSRSSVPTSPRPFHSFQEECSLNEDTFSRFKDRFQFPEETRVRLPKRGEKSYAFAHREICFYEASFLCSLRFPRPSIHYGAPSPPKHSPMTTYAKFLEDRYKLYGDLDEHS